MADAADSKSAPSGCGFDSRPGHRMEETLDEKKDRELFQLWTEFRKAQKAGNLVIETELRLLMSSLGRPFWEDLNLLQKHQRWFVLNRNLEPAKNVFWSPKRVFEHTDG